MEQTIYDAIVIGGGPAGLTAALYLARANNRVLVIEKETFGGQITITSDVVNYPGILKTSGKELTESMRQQAQDFGADFVLAEVQKIEDDGDFKQVKTTKGTFKCFGIVIATGAHPRKAGFIGEEEFKGHGIAYCATCDGSFFEGKEIFVVAKKYEAFYVNENEYEVIAFIYNTDRVNDLFVDSAYGGQAKLYVTNVDSMVTYADLDNNEGVVRNYNILDHYLDESVIEEEQYAQITEDFSEGRQNCVTLYEGKNAEYFYYQPLEGTEFFLVFQAPCAVVQSVLTDYQKKVSDSRMPIPHPYPNLECGR